MTSTLKGSEATPHLTEAINFLLSFHFLPRLNRGSSAPEKRPRWWVTWQEQKVPGRWDREGPGGWVLCLFLI